MSQGYVCNLKVAHLACGQVALHFGGDVAFNNLTVKQIHLNFQIGFVHHRQNFMGMVLSVDKKPRNAALIDGL